MSLSDFKCDVPGCARPGPFVSEQGWKNHMTRSHKGYTRNDETGARPSDVGRQVGGFADARSVADAAPETDEAPKPGTDRARKPRMTAAEAEQAERRRKAAERIGRLIAHKAATTPYNVTSMLLGDERWQLTEDEDRELTEATLQLLEAYDFDMSKPIWAVLALLAAHSDAIAVRLPLLIEPKEPPPADKRPEKPN